MGVNVAEEERVCIMRVTREHTAAVPILAPPPPAAAAASAAEEAEKKKKNRRRPSRRSRQVAVAAPQGPQADAAGPRSVRSMPPMHVGSGGAAGVDAEAEAPASAVGTSQSCPLLPTPRPAEAPVSRVVGRGAPGTGMRYFQPHWPERAVEDAVKRGYAFVGKFRVNAHNRNEAYCTIDGIPVDVLITGLAQNRARTSHAPTGNSRMC